MKILLTGASGMVGMNILEHSSVSSYKFLCPPKDHLNLLNRSELLTYLEKHTPDMIIHAAGTVGDIPGTEPQSETTPFYPESPYGTAKAQKELGWKSKISFQELVTEMVQYDLNYDNYGEQG